jgi:hypothetical protein
MQTLKIIKISEGLFKHVINANNDTPFYNTKSLKLSVDLGTIVFEVGSKIRVFRFEDIEVYDIDAVTPTATNTLDDLVTVLATLQYPPLLDSQSSGGGTGGTTIDRELVVTTYFVKMAFTGASIGDTVTATQIIDVTGTPTTVSTLWRNQTTGLDLASAPSAANLTLLGSQALTDAQLRAAALPVSNANLVNIDADLGATNDVAATTDTGIFSVISLLKRGLQNWTTLLSRVPTLGQKNAAGSTPVVIASDQGALAVAPNVSRGAGNVDANTQRVTLANDGQSALAIASIDTKTPALDNSRVPVLPSMAGGGNICLLYTSDAADEC